jgi:hypothetical protein
MLNLSKKIVLGVAGAALLAAPIAALAAHGKAGLWQITVTVGGTNAHMPDMASLPPEAQARLKAMGIGMGGNTVTLQQCMSGVDFSTGKLPMSGGPRNKSCETSNVSFTGSHMSADVTCTGDDAKTGHVEADWDSDDHYTEAATMTETHNGHTVTNSQKMEGRFLSAQCGATGQ